MRPHHEARALTRCPALLVALGSLALAGTSGAGEILVLAGADAGPGSLREAIEFANAAPGADVIVFDMASVVSPIVVTSPLAVADDLTLSGPGAQRLTISGGGLSRIFDIVAPVVTIEGLTVADGWVRGDGAGIRSWRGQEWLTLTDCAFVDNRCQLGGGGAVFTTAPNTHVVGCTFTGNAAEDGGALFNDGRDGRAALTLVDSVLTANAAVQNGGAIHNAGSSHGDARLSLYGCTLNENESSGPYGSGGAIYSVASNDGRASVAGDGNAEVVLAGCTLVDNTANEGGGALSILTTDGADTLVDIHDSVLAHNSVRGLKGKGGALELRGHGSDVALALSESTVDGNLIAEGPGDTRGFGGGLYIERNRFLRVSIIGTRITNNAAFTGGGLYLAGEHSADAVVAIDGNTLRGNHARTGAGFFDAAGRPGDGSVASRILEAGRPVRGSRGW